MNRAAITSLPLMASLFCFHLEAHAERSCTTPVRESERSIWDSLDRTVKYRIEYQRIYLAHLATAAATRQGDLSLCNRCATEVIRLEEVMASAPPSFLIPRSAGWREEWQSLGERNRLLLTEFVWPACDGKPVDWARFDEVR